MIVTTEIIEKALINVFDETNTMDQNIGAFSAILTDFKRDAILNWSFEKNTEDWIINILIGLTTKGGKFEQHTFQFLYEDLPPEHPLRAYDRAMKIL